jgi:hypothetical protein
LNPTEKDIPEIEPNQKENDIGTSKAALSRATTVKEMNVRTRPDVVRHLYQRNYSPKTGRLKPVRWETRLH